MAFRGTPDGRVNSRSKRTILIALSSLVRCLEDTENTGGALPVYVGRYAANGLDVDRGAVDYLEVAFLIIEGEEKVGAAEHDGFGALVLA